MFSSIRSRLLLSYMLLIGLALVIGGTALAISLQRSPLIYRQTVLRLRQSEAAVLARIDLFPQISNDRLQKIISAESDSRSLRIAIIGADGSTTLDTGEANSPALPEINIRAQANNNNSLNAAFLRDAKGKFWIYTLHSVENEPFYLLIATPRPVITLRAIFRDEVSRPFFFTGIVLLILAIPMGFLMARWISKPLQQVADSARKLAAGDFTWMQETGPKEVRSLAQAFNEMNHKLKASRQSQSDFIANISHELKTPLTSIQGFAQAMLDGTAQTSEAIKQSAGIIYNESTRMSRLVMDLLALTRLEGGTADLHIAQIELLAILNNILDKFSLIAQNAKITLRIKSDPLPVIQGDGDRLAQVFTNLVDNAIKNTPAGGEVFISAVAGERFVEVHVVDNGVGISLEDQARIFERFYQVDKSRRGGSGRGVGLGLAIAQQIILAHGGKITVQSTPGRGSSFIVQIPIPVNTEPSQNSKKGKS